MSKETADKKSQNGGEHATEPKPGSRSKVTVVVVVLAVFAILIAVKVAPSAPTATTATASAEGEAGKPSLVRDDPVAAYEAALATGKPIYVLFHSLTCDPCVEISAVADTVVPEYEDKVTFVNAITDDPGGQSLSARFQFQYIPTSFFVAPDGTVVDTFTGVLSADEMRGYLDALVAK